MFMKHLITPNLITIALFFSPVVLAADSNAGKSKAASCAACHGSNGISSNPEWPNIAGQNEKYLVSQLKAFRDGDRNSPLMSPMAKPLSDSDIDDISAYYATLK